MRLTCPLCGDRDRREFYYYGAADYADRPAADAPPAAWDEYLHNRDNPAGATRDLWYHEAGCGAWLVVSRNTVTHEVTATALLSDDRRRSAKSVDRKGDPGAIPSAPGPRARKPSRKPAEPRA